MINKNLDDFSVGTPQINQINQGGTPQNNGEITNGDDRNTNTGRDKVFYWIKLNLLCEYIKNKTCNFFDTLIFLVKSFIFTLLKIAPEIVGENVGDGIGYCTLNIGGGKRKCDDNSDYSDSYEEPTFGYLQKNRKILLASEKKHKSTRDLYLDDNQVNALICGVAAFVSRNSIRKVAILPSFFCTTLAAKPDADPIPYMLLYKSDYDILLAPIVTGGHWYLAVFFINSKIVVVYDSLHFPVPTIFSRLKSSIESVLHIQFTLKNENNTVTKQQNGFDCGINAFRNAEEICFHGKCNLIKPYYPEAERARAREILRKLKDNEITNEWVPHVQNPTHFTDLNKPTDDGEEQKELSSSDNTSDIECLEPEKISKTTVTKRDEKRDDEITQKEANIFDESFGCLNGPLQNMGLDESMEIDESKNILTVEEENEIEQKINENFIDYCNRKRIKKDSNARKDFNVEKNVAIAKLTENERLKYSVSNTVIKKTDDCKEYQLLSIDEESVLIKEVSETAAEFCKRKRIKNGTKGKTKYNQAIKAAKEKLAQNEKVKEYIKSKIEDNTLDTFIEVDEPLTQGCKVMTNAEEIKVQIEAKETYASYCKRLKISAKKSKNKYNAAIKNAQQKLTENERVKEYMKKKRLTESIEEKSQRLQQVAESMRKSRANETEEEKLQRLEKDAESKQIKRDNETEDGRYKRLQKDAESKKIKRENETEDEMSQRLQDNTNRNAINRTINRIEKQEQLKKEREERIAKIKELLPFVVRKAGEYTNVAPFKLGERDKICKGCGAKHYRTEKVQKNGTYTSCCKQGKIKMEAGVKDYPQNLKDLITKKHKNKEYMKIFNINTRMINSSLSCAHMYAKNVNLAPGVPYLKIQGKVLHKMTRTYLPTNNNATFGGQNYIVDSAEATMARVHAATKNNIKLNEDLMLELDETIREVNIFAKSFTMLKETMEKQKAEEEASGEKSKELRLVFKGKPNAKRNYDRVEAENEIALVYTPGPDGEIPRDDIVIFDKKAQNNNTYEVLPEWDPRVEPLSYTLFYPNGKGDFYSIDRKNDPNDLTSGKLTEREYYAFKINERCEEIYGFNPILYGGKHFLQYLCDAWAKVEGSRLRYLNVNQKKLKVASYKDVQEHLNREAEKLGRAPGSVKILPSTFYGGPRYLRELCSDAISMVDEFGKPTTLVTMTVNPEDEDIIMNLYEDQKAWERPDVVNSCFYQKLHELIRVIEKEEIFGPVECSVICIEFQKRGLPHCHCAFTLKEKWDTPEKVDSYIKAYLPPMSQEEADKSGEIFDEEYLSYVKKFMVHTPCGIHNPNAPCMVNGKCKRNFPRPFLEDTVMDDNGFTRPKRPDNKRCFKMKVKGNEIDVDNRWVVPHNPYLLKYMRSHINVEAINSIATVFYVFKYMFKGDDKAFVEMNEFIDNEMVQALNYDEIKSYEDFRYISATEAHWRLSDFWMYRLSHSVDRLAVHLENEQSLYMGEDADDEEMQKAKDKDSKLMAFFKVNQEREKEIEKVKAQIQQLKTEGKSVNHIKIPEKILYNKIGVDHVWDGKNGTWNPRKKTTKPKLCRLYNVNPKRTNCFYLRRLLMAVPGPTSFENLRTVDGVLYQTNREACVALGLVVNDKLYEDTLFEALNHTSPNQFRYLFARLLAHCDLGNPLELFDKFEEHLINDLLKKWNKEDAKKVAWRRIVKSMLNQDKHLSDYPELEAYMTEIGYDNEDTIDIKALYVEGTENYNLLNKEQKPIVDTVMERLEKTEEKSCYIYVDGIGGSGKSYTFNTIRKLAMGKGFKVVIMAWSGIAASLYPMGRTCHNAFKLEFPFESDSNSGVNLTSPHGKMLQEADIIIWDEFPMAPKRALEVVDSKLREIMDNDIPAGGKIILCGGDFRQCAPIVENGTAEEIIGTSVCCSPLWKHFAKFELTENVRALVNETEFKKFLVEIGDGIYGENPKEIEIPEECRSKGDIIDEIFGDVMENYDPTTVMKRAILATWNEDVDALNEQVLDLLDEETEFTYHAQDVYHYGDEILQGVGEIHQNYKTKNIKGLPSYRLRLRKNAIVMLIRNLSIEDGLCNGTRLVVTNLLKHNLVVKKINIDGTLSDEILIPRISLTAKHGVVDVTRHQFPVKLGFCMTINKSQGQTMNKVGVVLKHECFSHGQLYVAFSRVRSKQGLKIVTMEDKTTTANIVYKKLLELSKK